jgi:hypothetical protein
LLSNEAPPERISNIGLEVLLVLLFLLPFCYPYTFNLLLCSLCFLLAILAGDRKMEKKEGEEF